MASVVRSMGGDPRTSTSVSGDLHRRWVDPQVHGDRQGRGSRLNEAERGEDHALKGLQGSPGENLQAQPGGHS
ncbi:DUF2383 domain-containing protein [Pseudomonas peli]|uniref:DUF2383 domain-containing protein n=1 Tax=Pseudomonas peli TaxID=592361 RepID=UPI003D15B51A